MKKIVKKWIPPVLYELLARFRTSRQYFCGPYTSWEDAANHSTGYDANHILEKVLSAALKVKNGEAPYERDSILFDRIQYSWPLAACLLNTGILNNGNLHVLDFGGGLGSSYFQNRSFLEYFPNVSWNIVEQKHYVETGKNHIQNKNLNFYSSVDKCLHDVRPNLVLFSSVLQYLSRPYEVIEKIKKIGADFILVERTIINLSEQDFIYVQNTPAQIYLASYPCRSLSEKLLIRAFSPEYKLESTYPDLTFPDLEGINSEFKGYIFRKNINAISD